MSLNVSSTDISLRTGAIADLFNFLSKPFTVYKEPIKNINIQPTDPLYGYGDMQTSNEEITYTPVSQSFSGRLLYPRKQQGGDNANLLSNKIILDSNSVYIKMTPVAFNYLNNGDKTEKITFNDDTNWKPNGKSQKQDYLGLIYYYVQVDSLN